MNAKQTATLLATFLFAAAAYAGEKGQHKIEIQVIADDGDGETHLTLDSDDLGFSLEDMQVGENRSITDKAGRPVLITRTDDGYSFDVDGKIIDMPALGKHRDHGDANVWISKGDMAPHADVDVHVMHDSAASNVVIDTMDGEGVMIFSGKEIDDATQQIIRTALESTGHESVHFAGGDGDAPHGVHVFKKII
jgi:hypothetical protein